MTSERRATPTDATCAWCKKVIEPGTDKEWHVSLLGAPGVFHTACFVEYQAATP
jgi:hypothetical protein